MAFLTTRIAFVPTNCEIKKNDLSTRIAEARRLTFSLLSGIFLILWVFKMIYDCTEHKTTLDHAVTSERL